MPESTEEGKPVIETVMGIVGKVSGKNPKFRNPFHPINPNGEPIIPIEEVLESVYNDKGESQTIPLSTGNIVDLEA